MTIKLRKDNVVKSVDSEDKVKALEVKGFVRTDAKSIKESKEDTVADKLEKELNDTKEQLREAEKKIQILEKELSGTMEQLTAAVKKNTTAAARKEK